MSKRKCRKLFLAAVCCVVAIVAVSQPSAAVVIRGGDGSGNTTAPGDDPGWAYVGERGIGGAVYLGWRWVLTAPF